MNLLDLLFPKNCIQCGRGKSYLCDKCLQSVPFAETECPSCGRFSFYGKTHPQCISETAPDGIMCLWKHTGVIKKAISVIKYKFAYDVVPDVATAAAIEVNKFKLLGNFQCASVPLSRQRENWRGFNQAEELAKAICKITAWTYVPNLLVRTKGTTAQVQLSKRKRLRNIRGKIAVNMTIFEQIDTKSPLIIVDDVWTTGATLKECCRVLKLAGVKEIWGLTIAKA